MSARVRQNLAMATIILLCGILESANAEDSDFFNELHRPISLSSFRSRNPPDPMGAAAVLAAKEVIGKFFRSLGGADDPLRYMTPAYVKNAGNVSLRTKLVGGETQLLEVGVTDFTIESSNSSIEFKIYVLSFSEGSLTLNECLMTLDRLSDRWAIAKVCEPGK